MARDEPPNYVELGEIAAPHGINGTFRMVPTTDYPERLGEIKRVWLNDLKGPGWAVRQWGQSAGLVTLKLDAIANREQAQALKGQRIVIPRQDLPNLGPDTYYWHQLIGLAVRLRDTGRTLGAVAHVRRRGGAHDFLEVARGDGSSFWIPMVRSMVRAVDLTEQVIWVELPEGLEDLS
jgi:16S rRNA processing protein RimM